MYCEKNYKTKNQLKEDLVKGVIVKVVAKSPLEKVTDGTVYIEGPHYPQLHTWYAKATISNGVIVKLNS